MTIAMCLGCRPAPRGEGARAGSDQSPPAAGSTGPVAPIDPPPSTGTTGSAPLDSPTTSGGEEESKKPTFTAPIVDRPIRFDKERESLTVEYRREHQDPTIADARIDPRIVIVHHTGGGKFERSWRYFNRTKMESGRKKGSKAGAVNVSAHFLVDRDGTIYRLLPETTMARHAIGLNHIAIGIENVADGKEYPFTPEQVEANAALIRHLAARFALTHVVGHHEYLEFEGHPYFVERDPNYRTRKGDPGKAVMAQIRSRIADLDLQGPP